MRLTLRTLLAYLDDTLDAAQAREIGQKVAENPTAQELVERIKRATRKRSIATPGGGDGALADPNRVADYLSDALPSDATVTFEKACLESDVYLAEVAAVHQILTLLLCEQARVPPSAYRRMYELVEGKESLPNRRPGNVIPVGGVRPDEARPGDDADDDAAYLLGLSAISKGEKPRSRMVKSLLGVALGLIAFVGLLLAWPAATPPRPDTRYAAATPEKKGEPTPPAEPTPKAEPKAEVPPAKVEPPKAEVAPPKPDAAPPTPKVEPMPVPKEKEPAAPVPPVEPLPVPMTDPVLPPMPPAAGPVGVPPPSANPVLIGRWTKKEPAAVLVRRPDPAGPWVRVTPDLPDVTGGEKLVCLPGYKATVALAGGLALDLAGNLPDLLPTPVPILESSVTPCEPPAGVAADLVVHAGRVVVTAPAANAVVRLRVGAAAFDAKVLDAKSEFAVEVSRQFTPGLPLVADSLRTLAVFHVAAGRVEFAERAAAGAKPVVLSKGDEVFWESGGPGLRPEPPATPAAKEARKAYWSRFPTYPDTQRATAAFAALDAISKAIADPTKVRPALDEALQTPLDALSVPTVTKARVALAMLAAMGDVPALVGALNDPIRPIVRSEAFAGLRVALAADPGALDAVRATMTTKLRVPAAQVDALLQLLRGLGDAERKRPETLDRLLADMDASPLLPMRELSFLTLVSFIDPRDPASRPLLNFDAAGPDEQRRAVVRLWAARVEELKKKAAGPAVPAPRAAEGK